MFPNSFSEGGIVPNKDIIEKLEHIENIKSRTNIKINLINTLEDHTTLN